ncbi:TetR/AcrR family transcriptional regulator [Pseudovibrio exalbescens]|uniref:TetR/AcrR family transcriptional regulator n=1 Tax=Pseudovibrio exalbescens TaxID=197461 RepID=UPI002365B966|nr:TetR/AcrR family transcriptional regulator [Pseudovibrio exalbescens]MDD7910879.1 TetR/AcrR family transcriptional regulator [Pseudovibrio exalbescens]
MMTETDRPNPMKQRRNAKETRRKILEAARDEFASAGFEGARVDRIAESAGVNKNMLYHYFGNKDALFSVVLDEAYRDIRQQEAALELDHLSPLEAIKALVTFSWTYYLKNPEFIRLLNAENQLQGRHVKASADTRQINQTHLVRMKEILQRGREDGSLRDDIDPIQLNISIAALGFFYLINQHTLSTVYQRDLMSNEELDERLRVMQDTILCWVRR